MDGREGMSLSGSPASYYFNRGGISGPGLGPGSGQPGGPPGGASAPPVFNHHLLNRNVNHQSSNIGGGSLSSTFHVENPSHSFGHSVNVAVPSPVTPGDSGKKKRGRPRKYGPDGSNMSLRLSPMSSTPSSGAITQSGPQKGRGRPRGSGWKQQLAPLGEWMNSSAGLAFSPHIIHIGIGEDVAAKVLLFAQQRPRVLCILSANGSVSIVGLNQPVTSSTIVTYEGRFEILRLSGSYLIAETGGPRNRTGGLSISVCSPEGHVIGGAVGGKLIAASPVQVVACSFVYGGSSGSKTKIKTESSVKEEPSHSTEPAGKSSTPIRAGPNQDQTPNSAGTILAWPPVSRPDSKNFQTEIDLTRG